MGSANLAHPSLDELTAFTLGIAPDETAVELSRHLVECRACRSAVDELPDNALLTLLRQSPGPETDLDMNDAATAAA